MRTQEERDEQTVDITLVSLVAALLCFVPAGVVTTIASTWIDLNYVLFGAAAAYASYLVMHLSMRRRD